MHFYLVCNMNKIGRAFVIFILVGVATGAAEIKSKNQTNNKLDKANKPKEQTTKTTRTDYVSAHAVGNHGIVGVASIAGVDSRNGRVSSMSGIKIFPPVDSSMVKTDSKGNFIFKSVDGKMPMPITITKKGDGVTGTIRIGPGSVSVSSSSGSASAVSGHQSDYNTWPIPFMKPMMDDMFFSDPFPTFRSISNSAYNRRIPDSAFHRIPEPSFPRIPEPSFPRISEPSFPRIRELSFPRIPEPSFPRMPDLWMEKDMFKHTSPRHNTLTHDWFYPSFNPFINFW